jgi:prevent-host-death family protein
MTTENSLPNSEGPVESSRIGLRELGQNVSRVLSRVKNGESLVVTEHGRPIAYVTPHVEANPLDELLARGEATAAEASAHDVLRQFPPVPSPQSGSEVLAQMREEEQ